MRRLPGSRFRRSVTIVLMAFSLLSIGSAGFAWYLGYLHGPIYLLVPASAPAPPSEAGTVAVFFSGDTGLNAGMGRSIMRHVAGQGITVIGVNSLTAFSHRRSPDQVSTIVRNAVVRALALPGARRVVLIGHSFGANALLFGLQTLPRQLRVRVPVVELIVPSQTMLLRATPGGIFEFENDGSALPAARRLDWVPVLCILGHAEAESLCKGWDSGNVHQVSLPGDHFLDEDTTLVAATLLRDIAVNS